MVIRAWIEQGSATPLRAEIRHTRDVHTGFTSASTLTEADRVVEEVKSFLMKVVENQP